MGSGISRRRANRRQNIEDIEAAADPANEPTLVASEVDLAAQAQDAFMTLIKKRFRRRVFRSNRCRVEISGKADQYPYWMSTHNLQKHSGDHHKNTTPTELKYYLIQPDGEELAGHGKLPIYLHQQLNKTLKLQLKFKESNMSQSKQESHPEHKKLQRTVRTLLLKITANRKTPANDSSLVIKLYEQHFRARKKPQLRPMKCDGFFYDQRGNLAIMGDEFLLTVNRPKLTDRTDLMQGQYLRSLDTTLRGIITYAYMQNESCANSDILLPSSEDHYDEYAKLLLSRSSKELFTIKIPKVKR